MGKKPGETKPGKSGPASPAKTKKQARVVPPGATEEVLRMMTPNDLGGIPAGETETLLASERAADKPPPKESPPKQPSVPPGNTEPVERGDPPPRERK